jgi:hypothetical protein
MTLKRCGMLTTTGRNTKKYTVTYKCEFCGTYASFDEEDNEPKSDVFLLLEKKYRAQKDKEWKARTVVK